MTPTTPTRTPTTPTAWPTRTLAAGTAVLVVLLVVAGWFLLVAPSRSQTLQLRERAEEQRSASVALRARVAHLQTLERDLPAREGRLQELREQIPAEPRLAPLIRALGDAAGASGMTLDSVAPQAPQPVAPGGGPVATATTTGPAAAGEQLLQVPLTVTATGGYRQVQGFLRELEDMKRLLLVTGVTLAPQGAAPAAGAAGGTPSAAPTPTANPDATPDATAPTDAGSDTVLHLTLTGRVFVLGDPGAVPPGPSPAPGTPPSGAASPLPKPAADR